MCYLPDALITPTSVQAASPAVQIAAKKAEETRVAEAASQAARILMFHRHNAIEVTPIKICIFFPNLPFGSSIDFSDPLLIFSQVYLPMSIPHVTCLENSQKLLNSISISPKSHLLHQKEACDEPDRSGMVKMMLCTTELKNLNKNEAMKPVDQVKKKNSKRRSNANEKRSETQAKPYREAQLRDRKLAADYQLQAQAGCSDICSGGRYRANGLSV